MICNAQYIGRGSAAECYAVSDCRRGVCATKSMLRGTMIATPSQHRGGNTTDDAVCEVEIGRVGHAHAALCLRTYFADE